MALKINISLVLVFLYFLGTLNASAIKPSDDYVYSEELQSYYRFHTWEKSWNDARDKCRAENATLIVLQNQKEAEFYKKFIRSSEYYYEKAYTGLHAMAHTNDFRTEYGVKLSAFFDTWNTGEPNAWRGEENCISLWHNGKLNDESCDVRLPFMCTKTKTDYKLEKPCNFPYSKYFYNANVGKCYKLHSKKRSWSDAYDICKSEESHLAIVNNFKQANFYAQLLKKMSTSDFVHLGIHDLYGSGFETIYGAPLPYNKWSTKSRLSATQKNNIEKEAKDTKTPMEDLLNTQTHTADSSKTHSESVQKRSVQPTSEKCGSMDTNGELNKIDCDAQAFFICEHRVYRATTTE